MSFILQPLHVFVAVLIEYVRDQQELVIAYLQLENQVLREQIGGNRVLLTDEQRRLLAVKGNPLGRKQLGKIATIAQADTILRWHRELIQPKGDSKPLGKLGRPRTDQEVANLVLHMARENVSWGYKRIEGALHNLDYSICSSTVANILKQHGIEPAPSRQGTISWSTFLKSHWETFEGSDLNAIRLWLAERLNCLFGKTSRSDVAPIAAETSHVTAQETPKSICIHILEVADTEAQLARAPPSALCATASLSTRDISRAA